LSRTQRVIRALVAASALVAGVAGTCAAAQFVSIKGDDVNMRAAPSLRSDVLWRLGHGYPLKVLERKGHWFHVVDFESDKGWISRRFTTTKPHAVVKAPVVNLRSGPGKGYRVLRQAEYGEIFSVLAKRKAWVRVKDDDARTGWVARRLLWGF
jgi:SH3-like domain-containing protein